MQHIYENIFGWFSNTDKMLYDRAVEIYGDGDVFVEIGGFKGRSTSAMAVNIANSGKKIKFYCVDTWKGSAEHEGDPDFIDGSLYHVFEKNIAPVKEYVNPIMKSSVDAAKDFEDKTLSFVFIDASHDYENVMADIKAWIPKVKTGGVLSGHDVSWDSVFKAVVDYAKENNVNLYTFANVWWFEL